MEKEKRKKRPQSENVSDHVLEGCGLIQMRGGRCLWDCLSSLLMEQRALSQGPVLAHQAIGSGRGRRDSYP